MFALATYPLDQTTAALREEDILRNLPTLLISPTLIWRLSHLHHYPLYSLCSCLPSILQYLHALYKTGALNSFETTEGKPAHERVSSTPHFVLRSLLRRNKSFCRKVLLCFVGVFFS